MAAATLAVQVVAAEVVVSGGARQLVLKIVSTAPATAIPLADPSKPVDITSAATAKSMIGTALTLNYDNVTGAITSLT